MALQVLVLGALMVAATMAFVAGVSGREQSASVLEAIGQAIGLAALGIVFLGIPMLALILPLVVLWAVLVRRLSQSRDPSAKG